jgi:hypothetical protein
VTRLTFVWRVYETYAGAINWLCVWCVCVCEEISVLGAPTRDCWLDQRGAEYCREIGGCERPPNQPTQAAATRALTTPATHLVEQGRATEGGWEVGGGADGASF